MLPYEIYFVKKIEIYNKKQRILFSEYNELSLSCKIIIPQKQKIFTYYQAVLLK
jgi:hypothetical protein